LPLKQSKDIKNNQKQIKTMASQTPNSQKSAKKKIILGLLAALAVFAAIFSSTQAKILAEVTYNYGVGSTQTRQVIFDSQGQIDSLLASGTATVKKIRDIPDNLSKEEYDKIVNETNDYNQQQEQLDTKNASSSLWSIASWLPDKILRVLLAILYIVLWLFYSIAYGLVYLAESILKLVIDPALIKALGGLSTADFVKSVAQTLANLCNIFYLIFLLYIAFMTIIRKADTWRLLFKLVMAALLTNFGLVLAGAIIDVSQVIMYSIFTPDKIQAGFSPGTEILLKIQEKLKIGSGSLSGLYDLASKIFGWDKTGELLKDVLNLIFLIFVALALVITLLTVALILMIRIIALWIILILSPVAFLFYVLPQTEKWWNEWLESLFKYAFTGPILVFFLWLAKKIADNFKNIEELNKLGNNLPNQDDLKYAFYALVAQNFASFFQMLVLVAVIWAGILIANKFGIKGAKSLDQLLKSTGNLPGKIARGWGHAVSAVGRTTMLGKKAFQILRGKKIEGLEKKKALAGEGTAKAKDLSKEIEYIQQKMAKKDERMIKWRKGFALFTPQTIKQEFAKYWSNREKEYFEQSGDSLREFSRNFLNRLWDTPRTIRGQKRRDVELTSDNAAIGLLDNNRDLQKLREKFADFEAKYDWENRDKTEKEIDDLINNFTKTVTEDEAEQKRISVKIKKDVMMGTPNDNFLGRYTLQVRDLAEEKKKGEMKESFEAKAEKERRVKAKEEYLEKIPDLTLEQMITMFRRGDGGPDMQIALLRKIAVSGKHFGDLMQKMIDKYDNNALSQEKFGKNLDQLTSSERENVTQEARRRALEEMKLMTSGLEVIKGMRAADKEARTARNLAQIGYITFDKVAGKWRMAEEKERISAIGKFVKDMRPIEIQQLHVQSFEDPIARRSLAENINWKYLYDHDRFKKEVKETIKDNLKKYQGEFKKNIIDSQRKKAFVDLINLF